MTNMPLRQTILIRITKLAFCFGLCLTCVSLLLAIDHQLLTFQISPKIIRNFLFRTTNNTLKLQQMFPAATCPIGVELQKHDYAIISECTKEYAALEETHIDAAEMEFQRVVIHKPYLNREDSLLIEVGGFLGMDAETFIDNGIRPHYIMLEPVPQFYNRLLIKFKADPRFTILNFGLGREEKELSVPVQTDATSLFRQEDDHPSEMKMTNIKIRRSTEFFDEIGIGLSDFRVDLLHINCEGCEFELLEDLILTGYIRYFEHIQFQFHMHLPQINQEECRYCQIMQLLTRTHTPMFKYRHTWQAWKLIENE